jgi:hypothetical protein
MNDWTPKPLSRQQEAQRANFLGKIRETRQKFLEDFPEGCRVEFTRTPTAENPTPRIGKATVLKTWSTHNGRFLYVRYRLDVGPNGKPSTHDCQVQTFLRDNPVRIEEEQGTQPQTG